MTQRKTVLDDILQRLGRLRSRKFGVEIAAQTLLFVALTLSLATVSVLTELAFGLNSTGRTIIVLACGIMLAVFMSWFVVRPILQRFGFLQPPSDFLLARHVGKFFPGIHDRLLNLLQLHKDANEGTLYSLDLVDASFQDLAHDLRSTDFLKSVDRAPLRQSRRVLGISLVVALLPVVSAPGSLGGAIYRLAHFHEDFVPPSHVQFDISPGNAEVVKGQNIPVVVRVKRDGRPSELPLQFRWRPRGQSRFEEESLHPDSSGRFVTTLSSLRATTEYLAEYTGEESERFLLTVVDRPVIRSLRVRLTPPSYSLLPPQILDEFVGDVTALAGTRIAISGLASKGLKQARLTFEGDSTLRLAVKGQEFSANLTLMNETSYTIRVTDTEDLTNTDPVSYQLKIVADQSPKIEILRPDRSIDIAGTSSIHMIIQIKDDFGFSRLHIGYRLSQSRYEALSDTYSFLEIPLPATVRTSADVPYEWNLDPLHLAPEDVVEYFAEVFDNDAVRGPKVARTALYRLRLPSLQEVFTDLDKGHEQTIDEITKSLEDARELKERIESINEDLKKNKDPDWQQQKNMEETARRYEDLQKKMEDIRKQMDSMVDQMNQQNVLSPETMEKYLELQQMLEQIDSADLQNALKQLQQAMQNVNKGQLQQALQQVSFSEERFRESIERTLNLLKRIQIEQKLDEVKKRAEELTAAQEELAKQSEDGKISPEELATKQEDLAKKLKELQDASKNLQNRMEEFFTEMPEQQLQQANQALNKSQAAQKMSRSAQQMKAGQMQSAQQTQREVQKDLQQFSEQITQIQQQMMEQQQQYAINALRRATNDLLELSKREESLKEESKNAAPNSSQLRENAQEQLGVMNDLSTVIESLNKLGQRSFATTPGMGKEIGEAIARMREAMKSLDVRSGAMASQEQAKAMGALNRAAIEVQNALQAMLQQSGGQGSGGLMGQLQSMAGQQMSINMRTQNVGDAARLAMEQEVLRKSLEQLNREAQASSDQQRILGDLNRIASEMQEVVRDLEQNNVNPETIRKQERILSRLLDAARSTREQDYEKRRQSQTGTQVARRSPGELDPATLEGRNRLRDDLLKAIEQGYSKDYQELIRKYFEQLQKMEN